MSLENQNLLLNAYFKEGPKAEQKKTMKHIAQCDTCRELFEQIETMDVTLKNICIEESPAKDSYEKICYRLPATRNTIHKKRFSIRPLLGVAGIMGGFVGVLYFIHKLLVRLLWWPAIQQTWIGQIFGGFGLLFCLYFCMGILITLSLTPILIDHYNKEMSSKISYKRS